MLTMMTLSAVAALSGGQEYAPQQDGPQRVAPRGSYTQSCSGDYVNQGRLYADCRDERGRLRGTSILLNQCSQYDIANRNGLLVCGPNRGEYEEDSASGGGRGGGWGGGNGGGWGNRASITVYRDANYRGASQTFDGEVRDLARAGMNDQISSMRFRGEWEACTDANFRGYCQRFTGDVRNLSNYGMNDRVSSLRPVRGGRGGGRDW
ncbi:MAG TPA: beta/gamma crystallin-related protein [Brevundimonas sp.]